MPVHAAREHAATEAPARGGGNVQGHPLTVSAPTDREAHAPILATEWAASFMHGFNNPDTVRASYMPRTGSSPLLTGRGLVPFGQNMVARQQRGLADSTTAHSEIRTSFMPSDKLCEQQVDQPAQMPSSQPYQAPPRQCHNPTNATNHESVPPDLNGVPWKRRIAQSDGGNLITSNTGMRDATHSNIQPPSSVQTDASKCKQSTMQTLPITHNPIGELPSVGQTTPIASAIDCEPNGNATNTHIAMTIGIERNARLNT